ncbi:MAG: hypothetical protein K2K06_01460 [Oscillospiraceae bacterium]|nr:hypothetical protein [Oscillospiraceae bacterium]
MPNKKINICSECGSEYFKLKSKMQALCPECTHVLYGYETCKHIFINGRCSKCFWNGKQSDYIKLLKSQMNMPD